MTAHIWREKRSHYSPCDKVPVTDKDYHVGWKYKETAEISLKDNWISVGTLIE